ncbi:hypothetical protein [Microbulbifer halophilus]|uniref:Uncharacterized protein n=1 Tax=Microbulbifer halophilus TaxID=453963 RepID=A0ABW5EF75_9GAMM|nr:hypothetical protein [Microbulbifer halophilus]MCW8127387.1 hypothetical protein [Microbulbifer halophilus]
MTENDETYVLYDGHILEAIDRIHVAVEYLDNSLKGHPLIHSVNEFEKEVDRAIEILADLYQKVGIQDGVDDISRKFSLSPGYQVASKTGSQ